MVEALKVPGGPLDPKAPVVDAVLFDLDGTLIDTYELILVSMQHAVREVLGKDLPDNRLMCKVGQPLAVQMRDFTDEESQYEELLRVYREYNAIRHDELAKPFPETEATLEALRLAGYPLAVVTSKRHAAAMKGLRLFGLDAYFSHVVGSDDVKRPKPDPEPVRYGAELVGAAPQHCLYIGDSPYDIQAGRGAGSLTAAALWGMFSEAELKGLHPDFTCQSIAEILDILS